MADQELKSLQAELKKAGARWIAGRTSMSDLTPGERRARLGCVPGKGEPSFEELESISASNYAHHKAWLKNLAASPVAAPTVAASIDWRNVGGRNFISSIKNQGQCGSCVAFAQAATMEARVRTLTNIAVNDPGGNILPDLSEAQLFFCGAGSQGRTCANGWSVGSAMSYAQSNGIVPDSCFPYSAHDQPCNLCSNSQNEITQISAYHTAGSIADMKAALAIGPLMTRFNVYADFNNYTGGVYHHTSGALEGGHAVCCVGYSDTLQAWLCKNSWGSGWGESGYFWIGYGQCGIDASMYVIDGFSKIYPLYDDLFMRNTLTDVGEVPATGTPSHSPDIVPVGTMPLRDADTYLEATWNQDVGKNVEQDVINYIYLRGKNLKNGPAQGEAYLYYAPASLLLWPDQWKNNALQNDNGAASVAVDAAALGEVFVTPSAFTWKPAALPNDHYCLIGRITTADHPNPIPTGPFANMNDFVTYVLGNPGMAWRNVTMINPGDKPEVQVQVKLETQAQTELFVMLNCENLPLGSAVSFASSQDGPEPPIQLDKSVVTTSPDQLFGMHTSIPANFSGMVTVSFYSNGKAITPGAKLTLEAFYPVPAGHELERLAVALPKEATTNGVAPQRVVLVGSFQIVLTT